MGCTTSKERVNPSSKSEEEPNEAGSEPTDPYIILNELLDQFETAHIDPASRSSWRALRPILVAECHASQHEDAAILCQDMLLYLTSLIAKPALFSLACVLIQHTNMLLKLNDTSLNYLVNLYQRDQAHCEAFFHCLAQLCDKKNTLLALRGHHLDAVILGVTKQNELPPNALSSFKSNWRHDFESTRILLQQLRDALTSKLAIQGTLHNLVHHTPLHALEIRARATKAAFDVLGLFKSHPCLREIISFIIEFHDYEYKEKANHATVEEATAAFIIERLQSVLELSDAERQLIDVISHFIIVLGTTMVFSPSRTLDLSELFFITSDGPNDTHASNHVFLTELYAIMLITGICDKNPASIFNVILEQADHAELSTMSSIQQNYKPKQLLGFFNSPSFHAYFDRKIPLEHDRRRINQQAFCVAFVPHLCMRIELSGCEATRFTDFIHQCHQELAETGKLDSMPTLMKHMNMTAMIERLFFLKIDAEIAFCQSQYPSLLATVEQLKRLGSLREGLSIHPEVPLIDARNLGGLVNFYNRLTQNKKEQLIMELLLIVVHCAGAIYVNHPEYNTSLIRAYSLLTPSQSHSKRATVRRLNKDQFGFFSSDNQSSTQTTNQHTNRVVPDFTE